MPVCGRSCLKNSANERQRASLANGAGRGAPASEPAGGSGGEAPGQELEANPHARAELQSAEGHGLGCATEVG
jgi:hypothetical protein